MNLRLVACALLTALLATGCQQPAGDRLTIVATTANVTAVVTAVAGDRVNCIALAPAGMCPGHFDIRPSHVAAATRADVIIRQGWEEWFDGLARELPEPRARVHICSTGGNWMLPDVHRSAVGELTELLAELDTVAADTFRSRAAVYLAQVDSAARVARSLFSGRTLPHVLAAEHQAPLLRWLGFRVVATYGRPEEFTASELTRLASIGTDSSVGIVIDNLQSGPGAGRSLSAALHARHVNLTNFPLDDDYPTTLIENARALARLLD